MNTFCQMLEEQTHMYYPSPQIDCFYINCLFFSRGWLEVMVKGFIGEKDKFLNKSMIITQMGHCNLKLIAFSQYFWLYKALSRHLWGEFKLLYFIFFIRNSITYTFKWNIYCRKSYEKCCRTNKIVALETLILNFMIFVQLEAQP